METKCDWNMTKSSASVTFQGACPIPGHWHFSHFKPWGECQEEQPPICLPPQPHWCCRPGALASLHSSTVWGVRQCWAHGEIRVDGWHGWPGGWDNSLGPTQQVCSGRRCSLLPPRPYLPPLFGKEVRTWPCVCYYKSVSTFLNGKSYLRKR